MFTQSQQQQGVQPARQPDSQPFPKLPDAKEPNLFNSDPSDVDFGFDPQSGEFQIFQKKKPEQQTQDQTKQTQGQQTQQTQTQAPNYDAKFTELDGKFALFEKGLQAIAAYVEGMSKGQQSQQQQSEDQTQLMKLDLQSDDFATNLVNLINTSIAKALDERINPINTKMAKVDDRMLLSDLAMKYGPRFVELYPIMDGIKKSDPNVSWENLYLNLDKHIPAKPTNSDSTIQTSNGSNNQGQPQGVQNQNQQQNLQQRADQLATERGGVPNSIVTQNASVPKGKELEAAFDKAMEELFGGH